MRQRIGVRLVFAAAAAAVSTGCGGGGTVRMQHQTAAVRWLPLVDGAGVMADGVLVVQFGGVGGVERVTAVTADAAGHADTPVAALV